MQIKRDVMGWRIIPDTSTEENHLEFLFAALEANNKSAEGGSASQKDFDDKVLRPDVGRVPTSVPRNPERVPIQVWAGEPLLVQLVDRATGAPVGAASEVIIEAPVHVGPGCRNGD